MAARVWNRNRGSLAQVTTPEPRQKNEKEKKKRNPPALVFGE